MRSSRVRLRIPIVLAGLVAGSVAVGGHVAAADLDSVEESLRLLGVDDAPASVIEDVAALLPEGLEPVTDGEPSERLEASIRTWEIVATEWRDVPEGLMVQVRECRDLVDPDDDVDEVTESSVPEDGTGDGVDDGDVTDSTLVDDSTDTAEDLAVASTEECGEQLRIRLRVEHAERLIARFTERIAEAEGLPEQARAEVVAAMLAVRERAERRLVDLLDDEDGVLDAVLAETGRDRAELVRVREQVAEQAGELDRLGDGATDAPGTTDGRGDGGGGDRPGGAPATTSPAAGSGRDDDADDTDRDDDQPGRTTVVDGRDSDRDEQGRNGR